MLLENQNGNHCNPQNHAGKEGIIRIAVPRDAEAEQQKQPVARVSEQRPSPQQVIILRAPEAQEEGKGYEEK